MLTILNCNVENLIIHLIVRLGQQTARCIRPNHSTVYWQHSVSTLALSLSQQLPV